MSRKGSNEGSINGGLKWTTVPGGPAITVAGQMNRKALAVTPVALALPEELKKRMLDMVEGGGTNGALVGLIHFALDEIERQKVRLRVQLNG